MLGLYFFGPRLELVIGGGRFLTLYFTSGIAGALLSLLTPTASIVGASAAIFGVFYGYAHYWPRDRILVWGIVPVEARLFVILMTVISLGLGLGPRGLAGNTTLHPVNREELDRVLAKLADNGPVGLTAEERAFLDRFSSASR